MDDRSWRYWSYLPDDSFHTHATAEEAERRVSEWLDAMRLDAAEPGEWCMDIEDGMWGTITGRVREADRWTDPETGTEYVVFALRSPLEEADG